MTKTISTFGLVAVVTALLMALSIAVTRHGDAFGTVGVRRLDGLASAATFIPLAAVYFFGVGLLMILPLRAASFVRISGVDAVFLASIVLFATIVGCILAKVAFGQTNALRALMDWRFLFVAAIIVCNQILDEMRRNILIRSLSLVASMAAILACLFWTFRL